MALNTSGPISLGGSTTGESIATELGQSSTGTISLNDTNVRSLAAVPSGQITIPGDFYGKSVAFNFNQTISSDTNDYNLKNAAIAAGWNQTTPLVATVTINGGVTVRSTSTASAAFNTGTSFPSGSTIALINNGTVLGQGGSGGTGGVGINTTSSVRNGNPGGAGGPAISLGWAIALTNNNIIAGGGGGGGGGGGADYPLGGGVWQVVGGSGGGGGAGFGPAGAGGGTSAPGGSATRNGNNGSAGTATAGGAGGPITNPGGSWFARGGAGGNGGGWGSAGSAGSPPPPGFTTIGSSGGAGGAAGKAINLNGFSVTYLATGQIYGAVS